jgi:ABC-type phosphate transport system permease subunit
MELLLELSMYAFLLVVYVFFTVVVFVTQSNHNFIKVLRVLTLPLMFLPILVLLFMSGFMLVKDYVQTGSQAFKR